MNLDDPAYLRRQYAWFLAQPPARQQQLRRLHADFQQLPAEDQGRLTKIAQTYNAWLAKLPEDDRQRVLNAPTAADRLEEVRRLREREWVESLPKPYRDEFARLDGDARRHKVQEWRADESERREEWALAQKHWADNPPGRIPPAFAADRTATEAFVTHLRDNLTEPERRALDDARGVLDEFGLWFGYGFLIARFADLHPIVPWSNVGPKDWKDLPDEVRRNFPRPLDVPELRRARGRWPEFAIEVAAYARRHNVKLPPLGDCTREQMPTAVQDAIDRLEKDLRKTDPARAADLKALADAHGKWPDYPRLVLDLSRKYNKPIPGWTLPGPPKLWDELRASRGKGR